MCVFVCVSECVCICALLLCCKPRACAWLFTCTPCALSLWLRVQDCVLCVTNRERSGALDRAVCLLEGQTVRGQTVMEMPLL